jgi:hypothetical protein
MPSLPAGAEALFAISTSRKFRKVKVGKTRGIRGLLRFTRWGAGWIISLLVPHLPCTTKALQIALGSKRL